MIAEINNLTPNPTESLHNPTIVEPAHPLRQRVTAALLAATIQLKPAEDPPTGDVLAGGINTGLRFTAKSGQLMAEKTPEPSPEQPYQNRAARRLAARRR